MIGKDLGLAIDFLKKGEVVGIPTETVYGLAANALNKDAVLSVFEIKNRPHFDPLIIHLPNFESIVQYTINHDKRVQLLAEQLMPGPLTLLLHKNDKIPYLVTSGSEKVACRIPQHPLSIELLKQLDFPLAAPSANPFGYISPTKAIHVEQQLGDKIPYILDGGECMVGIESTIIDCTTPKFEILRLGGCSIETIEQCLGEKVILNLNLNSNPKAPGQLDKHYSPRTPMKLVNDFKSYNNKEQKRVAFLTFGNENLEHMGFQLNLSASANLSEAAKNLFDMMRQLDEMNFDLIVSKLLPEHGIGLAVNDRLKRASIVE